MGPSKPPTSNNKTSDPRTLFVKFHPPSASITRQHLSDHFSNYGPVNRCSVIRQKQPKYHKSNSQNNNEGGGDDDDAVAAAAAAQNNSMNLDRGSKGYGFVRFVHEEDAKAAADAIRKKASVGGSSSGKGDKGGEIMIVDGVHYRIHAERAVDAAANASASKKGSAKKDTASTTTKQQQQQQKQEGADTVGKKKEQTIRKVEETPSTPLLQDEDAIYKAEAKRKRTSRVIVRNLSFYANEKHVKTAMESAFGSVVAVDLPLVPSLHNEDEERGNHNKKPTVPRHRGFAFVTFANASSAKKAVEEGGEVKIKNRLVAIDYSVSKLAHQQMMKEKKNDGKVKEESDDEEKEEEESEVEEGSDKGEDSKEENSEDDGSSDSNDDDEESDASDSDDDSEEEGEDEDDTAASSKGKKDTAPEFDQNEAQRTLFLRNIPFDATRHDIFELFRTYGRIQAVYLVKDPQTGVFRGTAFVRFENGKGTSAALEAAGIARAGDDENGESNNFISSKNLAIGLGQDGMSGLMLKGRNILVDLAVDRSTASSLAVQRDEDGKPLKKMIGKDRRNLYLKSEGRVSSAADSAAALEASAKHGGTWEDLPQGDRAKRERAFADKSTKLRSPLFFINPYRLGIRNLGKHVNEADLKRLVTGALKTGLEQKLFTPNDAVAHWRAGGELAHSEVMKRATDPTLVTPPFDEKNTKESIPSVFIDRDFSGGKKTADAPSRGFGFVEFTHHAHALTCLRQLNNNPIYSAEFAMGGKHASEMKKQQQRKGKKSKNMKVDETDAEFVGDDGKVNVPRLIVEFTVENKVKARQQADKIAQKKANKIKQKIENNEKEPAKKKENKKSRGALQREKKRARKEAGNDNDDGDSKKPKLEEKDVVKPKRVESGPKLTKPPKKRKVDSKEDALEDMIRSYKASFSGKSGTDVDENKSKKTNKMSRESVAKKRWFE